MSQPTSISFRALCAELVNELYDYKVANEQYDDALVNRARAALAQPYSDPTEERRLGYLKGLEDSAHAALAKPEPKGGGSIHGLGGEILATIRAYASVEPQLGASKILHESDFGVVARVILTRWGRPAIEPVPGEVEELVRRLRDWQSIPLLEERERIATLLQQLSTITTEDLKND
jgi:hypothetical protein